MHASNNLGDVKLFLRFSKCWVKHIYLFFSYILFIYLFCKAVCFRLKYFFISVFVSSCSSLILFMFFSLTNHIFLRCWEMWGEDRCRLTPWSTCVSTHSPTLTFSMNGDMPHVPITTLAGIASLTDCECHTVVFQTHHFSFLSFSEIFCLNKCKIDCFHAFVFLFF